MPGADSTVPAPRPRLRFAGLPIDPLTVDETVRVLAARAPNAPFSAYVTPNVEAIYHARKSPDFHAALERCVISTNDSRILRALGRFAGLELDFAPGSYVVDRLFEQVVRPGDALSVIGGTPQIVDDLRRRFGLTDIVQHIPPMGFIHDPAAIAAAVDFIAAHPARFVFVSMGPPQSERLCLAVIQNGRATGIGLCTGSALQVLTGTIGAAPDWMEQSGLVWLHRLAREPGRLWRRYLVHDLFGVLVCLFDIVRLRLRPAAERGLA
jgi:exopolysaccharide biosynthesis WecB/TagA/CpsF family protein